MSVGWQPHTSLDILPVSCWRCTLNFLPLLSSFSSKVPPFESWESCTSQVSGAFGGGDTPNLLFPEVSCLYSFCWPSGLQSFSLTQYQIRFPSFPFTSLTPSTFLPRFFPPSPLVIAFFSLPSGTEACSLGRFFFLTKYFYQFFENFIKSPTISP